MGKTSRFWNHTISPALLLLFLATTLLPPLHGETCLAAADMDAATRAALQSVALRYFGMAARGDVASLRQNAIASLAADFAAIETAVTDNKANLSGSQPVARPPFLLQEESTGPAPRAEFLCGVFGKSGQTADSAVFVIPNLAPGAYGIVILDLPAHTPVTASFVLQQQGPDWKLGGLYIRPTHIDGRDGNSFAQQAAAFKARGQVHNAWLYYREAAELLSPLPFMSTLATDKLYDDIQTVQPSDMPISGPVDLVAGGRTYRLTAVFPLAVGDELDLVVKYQVADISNTAQTFQENVNLIKAFVAKYPELRSAFAGIVARAVEPSGRDYGSLLPMKEIK
jgi:hypothetical protein